jgi:hypothetical protein
MFTELLLLLETKPGNYTQELQAKAREEERRRYSQVLCRLLSLLVVALRKKMMLVMKTTLWIVRTRRARVKVKGGPCKLDTGAFNLHLCPKLSCNWL